MPITAEQAIYTLLAANAPLKALVGSNIFEDVAHEGTEGSWVVFSRISNDRISSHDGFDGLSRMRFQVTGWTLDPLKRKPIRDAIIATLDEVLTTVSGSEVHIQHENDMNEYEDGPPKRYGSRIDFFVWI